MFVSTSSYDDVKAPVGAPHSARARQHPRRDPSESLVGRSDGRGQPQFLACVEVDIPATTKNAVTKPRPASRDAAPDGRRAPQSGPSVLR